MSKLFMLNTVNNKSEEEITMSNKWLCWTEKGK